MMPWDRSDTEEVVKGVLLAAAAAAVYEVASVIGDHFKKKDDKHSHCSHCRCKEHEQH